MVHVKHAKKQIICE